MAGQEDDLAAGTQSALGSGSEAEHLLAGEGFFHAYIRRHVT